MTSLSAGRRARLLAQVRAAPTLPWLVGERRTEAPASYAQQQLWFIDQLTPGVANYNVPFAFTIEGPLNVEALCDALAEITRRHDSLRTSLRSGPDGLRQVVEPSLRVPVDVVELDEEAAWRRCAELVRQPFDLAVAPLWRATLIRITPIRHLLVWVASHAVADGWSVGLLIRELAGAGQGTPPQFTDYAVWQREMLAETMPDLLGYWRGQLSGCPVLGFPYDRPRPAAQSFRGRTHTFPVAPATTRAVTDLARALGVTPFSVTMAAYQAILSAYCGHRDIAVGTPVACRDHAGFDDLMGSLVNTIVLRVAVDDARSFTELVRTVADTASAGFAHQDLPFGKLVEELRPARNVSYNPVCQTVFSFGSTPATALTHRLGDATLTFAGVSNDTVRFDFELALDESADGWTGRLEYALDLWTPASAAEFCTRYADLLAAAVADPTAALSRLLPVIDRRPPPEVPDSGPASLPRTGDPEIEDRLRRLWQAALARTDIGTDDDFFALGGHSMLAAELVAEIRDQLGCELALTDLFMNPTIGELAGLLSRPNSPENEAMERVAAMSDEEVAARLRELGL